MNAATPRGASDDFVFNTAATEIKGRALMRNGWGSICVDDQQPPYPFVTVSGPVTISTEEMLPFATRIGALDCRPVRPLRLGSGHTRPPSSPRRRRSLSVLSGPRTSTPASGRRSKTRHDVLARFC